MSRYRAAPAPTTLYFRNISDRVRYDDLRRLFMKYGKLIDVTIPLDYYSGLPKGYCFVEFEDPRDAEEAQYRMDRQRLFGKEIEVEFARGDRKTPGEMRTRGRDDIYRSARSGSGRSNRMDDYYRGRSRSRDERGAGRERVERTRDVSRSRSREPSFRSRSRSYSRNRTPTPRAERSNNHHKSMSRSRSPRERSNSRQRRNEARSPQQRNSRSLSPRN